MRCLTSTSKIPSLAVDVLFIFRKIISSALLVIFVLLAFATGRVWYTANHAQPKKSDAIVVLGAAQFDGRPSDVLLARLEEAARIFHNNFAPRILTVGANAPGDRTTEAAASKVWLEKNKITKVVSIPQGHDTLESTKAFARYMKLSNLSSAVLVTDPYHCLRAITMAHDFGISATCSPVRGGPNSLNQSGVRYLVRETGAYLAYLSLGRHGISISDRTVATAH